MRKKFAVDPAIENDSIFVTDLIYSSLYLKRDKDNPWFVIVPKKADAVELIDLSHEEQTVLMEEITIVSDFLKKTFNPTKLNVGNLGNIVKQLHIHVIARYEGDRAWPGPIWGTQTTLEFTQDETLEIIRKFRDFIR